MQLAATLFGLAALGGILMAIIRLRGAARPPMWLALGHGALAATGLGILIYTNATQNVPKLGLAALVGFVLAALGGLTLFIAFHLRERAIPIPLVLSHGAIAATSFVLLLLAIFW